MIGRMIARLNRCPPAVYLSRLSLRMRLLSAFVVLIVSSASATILIGNTVFSRKVDELARSKVGMDLKVAEQILTARLDRLRLLAEAAAMPAGEEPFSGRWVSLLRREAPIDTLLSQREPEMTGISFDPSGVGHPFRPTEADRNLIDRSDLGELGRQAAAARTGIASVVLLPEEVSAALGMPVGRPGAQMAAAAAAPLAGGGALLLAHGIDRRNELVDYMLRQASPEPESERNDAASIFLGTVRVSSTLGSEAIGSEVDPEVAERALSGGETYVGAAQVAGRSRFTAAYSPIRDFRGRNIGLLGIGTSEDVFQSVRRDTMLLFSSLIAGGMVFGFIMIYLFSRLLMRPVSELALGMARVAEGDLGYKVRIHTADELGALARAFNTMARAVRERDMKLRQITEEQLSRVEKQVSIGRLAAGVAHEINNPLTAILSLSSLMRRHLPTGDPRHEDLSIIIEETTRCRDIVRGLLDFARERPPEKRVVDVSQVMRDTLLLAGRYDAMGQVRVEQHFHPEPLLVNVDTKQLQQVFTNLLINAAEAMESGGTITIATDDDTSGGFVVVRVTDSGKGIPPEHVDRVFEPFFTTKGTGRGTGLGLSVSLGIVQHHGGAIEVESRPGAGTTMSVILPRVEA